MSSKKIDNYGAWLASEIAAVKKTHAELKQDRAKPVMENFDWEASEQFNQS